MPKISSIVAHNNAFAPTVDSDTIRGGFLNVRATAQGLAGEFDTTAALQSDGNKQDLVKEKGTVVYVTDQSDYFILNNKSASDVAPGSEGSGWITLRSAIGAGTGSSDLALTDLSVTSNSASGGGSLSYDNTSGAFTFTPASIPDVSSFIDLADLSVTSNSASGGGSLSYDNTSGAFTFTPASIPDVSSFIDLADLSVTSNSASGGGSLSYDNTSGAFTFTPASIPDVSSFIDLADLSVTSNSASGGGSLSYDNTSGAFTFTPASIPDVSSFIDLADLSVTSNSASGGGSLSYDNTSGAFTFTPASIPDVSSFIDLADLSVTSNSASGGGSLSYDNTSGAFTFTPASIPDVSSFIDLADLSVTSNSASGGGSLSYDNTSGAFTFTPASIPDVSGFLTSSDLSGYAQLSGATFTGNVVINANLTVQGDFISQEATIVTFRDTFLDINVAGSASDYTTDSGFRFGRSTNAADTLDEMAAFTYYPAGDVAGEDYTDGTTVFSDFGAFRFTRHKDSSTGDVASADNVLSLKFNKQDTCTQVDQADDETTMADGHEANATVDRSLGAVAKARITITSTAANGDTGTDPNTNYAPDTAGTNGYPIRHNLATQSVYVIAIKDPTGTPTPVFCKYEPIDNAHVRVTVGKTAATEVYDIIVIG